MVMNRFNLDKVLDALEAIHEEKGFVTYQLVGQRVGLSRQAVQIGIKRRVASGDIPEAIYEKYWPSKKDLKEIKFNLDSKTVDFIRATAQLLGVRPQVVVESAIAHYRQHLKSTTTPSE